MECGFFYKPDPVLRPKVKRMPFIWDRNYSRPLATYPETGDGPPPVTPKGSVFPYLVLLLMGFT